MRTAIEIKQIHILLSVVACMFLSLCVHESRAQVFILTNDQQLRDLANSPEKEIDNNHGNKQNKMSLKQAVEQAKSWHSDQIVIAFDEFFRQYRDDKNTERKLTPDMDEYVNCIAKISNYTTKNAGAGLQLSLLSPLELGQAYRNQTGNTGKWAAFKVGMRNAQTGKFSIQMWQQTLWTNNKGATPVKLGAVKAYAFKGKQVDKTKIAVNPDDIRELKNVEYEVLDTAGPENGTIPQQRLRIYGEEDGLKGYDNVLVILEYETQEIDYFADDALPFLKNLLKKYHDAGVDLRSLYCDEMHIQQDWIYFAHQEDGQFNERFYTDGMGRMLAQKTGMPFDLRYMLYFVNQPLIYKPTVEAILNVEYVLGEKPEDIQRTYLMRDNYYRLLNNHVVDLFVEAKHYGEKLFNREFRTGAHASWAESPTIDKWESPDNTYSVNYEYTPNYLWGNTVHQASAACYDYFKWCDYLQPTGNDFCECGWLDRNYYGAAMAASIGVINKYPNAYAAAWGMPAASYERRMAINYAYGCDPPANIRLITDFVVDRIFPVVNENSEVAATCNGEVIGTVRDFPNNGRACFMGCRLRDDQSRSLGYESRNMFEVLNYLGAYPASGTFKNRNDNPSFLSRTGDYFVSSFPNGTTMVVNHYRTHVENWDGNFSRNPEYDAEILKNNPLRTDTIKLYNAAINGHIVSYTGRLSMGFNVKNKRLCSFYGQQCNEITVDGTKYIFSAGKQNDITFGPVNGDLTHYNLYANGAERIEIPVPQTVNGAKATVDGNEISVSVKRGTLVVNLKPEQYGHLVDIHFTNAR